MPRKYDRPPVVEALTSFRFESADPWDWTIPGLLYAKIRKDFPRKRALSGTGEVVVGDEVSASSSTVEQMQFFSPNENAVVQVAPNTVTFGFRAEYPGWPEFRKLALRQLTTYMSVSKDLTISGVALSYVNRIVVPAPSFDLDDYFNVFPGVPVDLDEDGQVGEFFIDTALVFTNPDLRVRLRFGSAAEQEDDDDESAFTMQLNAGSTESARFEADDVRSWLDTAHARIEAVFDASFTDRAHKELFGEVVTTK